MKKVLVGLGFISLLTLSALAAASYAGNAVPPKRVTVASR